MPRECVISPVRYSKGNNRFGEVQAGLSNDPDAYSVRGFNVGFEGWKHWVSEVQLSALSLCAVSA